MFGKKKEMVVCDLTNGTIKQGYNAESDQFWFQIIKYHYEKKEAIEIQDDKEVKVMKDVKVADEQMRISVTPEFYKNFNGASARMTYGDTIKNKTEKEKQDATNKTNNEGQN